jgi:hypothetical protein
MATRTVVLSRSSFIFCILFFPLLLLSTAAAFAQRVETKDAGGGRKIELHYNAAGQVTETDTIGPDGKLLEKDTLEYPAGALVPQSVSTSYWPNGQVHKITHNTYDNNSNFTGEFIQIFDESGKQMGGHRLTHDPQTNVYTCADWNTAANAYKPVECPAGEEAGGSEETAKKFTAEEVMQQLAHARSAKPQPPRTTAPPPAASAGNNVREVGLVLPTHIRPGERVSGSVVENPADYESWPEVMITRFALPFAASGPSAALSGWQVDISGEPTQAADGPIALTVPPGQIGLAVLLHPAAESVGGPVAKTINMFAGSGGKGASGKKGPASASYMAPAICVKGQLCVVQGAFNGNSSKTFAAFEARPARIIAETTTALYLAIPEATEPGPRPLAIAEGAKAIAFPMVVAEYTVHPTRRDLTTGGTMLVDLLIEGPGDVPDQEWRPGNYPASNLDEARKVLPGFQPAGASSAHDKHEAEERREKEKHGEAGSEENEGGEILLIVKNLTPDIASFRDSKNGMYVFHLNGAAFKMGDFKYKFVVEAKQAGSFGVQSWVIPFLAPVKGQEFPMEGAASQ